MTQSIGHSVVAVIRESPTVEEWTQAWNEIKQGTDRSAALLAAAFSEDALRHSISQRFWDLSDSDFDKLCKPPGPLSSFYAMIELGYALGIYRDVFRKDLHAIRTIQHGFAQAMKPLSFDAPEVVAELAAMKYLDQIQSAPPVPLVGERALTLHDSLQHNIILITSNRERYIFSCELIAHDLISRGSPDDVARRTKPMLP
jgi:hypothetical protein